MKTMFPVAFFTFAVTGCAGTLVSYQPTSPPPRPMHAQPWKQVEFRTTPPARPYTTVGVIQAQPESLSANVSPRAMMTEMLQRAGAEGCDGLIWLGRTDVVVSTDQGMSVIAPTGLESVRGYRANCFLYNKPGAVSFSSGEQD